MNKRSIWQRGNRGFLLSMILLAGVLIYISVSSVMLVQDKAAVQDLSTQVENMMMDILQSPLEERQAVVNDPVKTAAYKDSLKKKLEPLFVKDSAYLEDSAERFMTLMRESVMGEETVSNLEPDWGHNDVQVIENVAASNGYKGYEAIVTRLDYNNETGKIESVQSATNFWMDLSVSFAKEGDEWKIYHISGVYYNY